MTVLDLAEGGGEETGRVRPAAAVAFGFGFAGVA